MFVIYYWHVWQRTAYHINRSSIDKQKNKSEFSTEALATKVFISTFNALYCLINAINKYNTYASIKEGKPRQMRKNEKS